MFGMGYFVLRNKTFCLNVFITGMQIPLMCNTMRVFIFLWRIINVPSVKFQSILENGNE